MNQLQPPIDILLRAYFEPQIEGATGVMRQRIHQVDTLLRDFLQSDGPRTLCSCNLTILAAEDEFEPDNAFARSMHADELLLALPLFLSEVAPQTAPLLRRVLLHSIDALTGSLLWDNLVDPRDQMYTLSEIRGALYRERAELNRPRREKQRAARRAVKEEMGRRRAAFWALQMRPAAEARERPAAEARE